MQHAQRAHALQELLQEPGGADADGTLGTLAAAASALQGQAAPALSPLVGPHLCQPASAEGAGLSPRCARGLPCMRAAPHPALPACPTLPTALTRVRQLRLQCWRCSGGPPGAPSASTPWHVSHMRWCGWMCSHPAGGMQVSCGLLTTCTCVQARLGSLLLPARLLRGGSNAAAAAGSVQDSGKVPGAAALEEASSAAAEILEPPAWAAAQRGPAEEVTLRTLCDAAALLKAHAEGRPSAQVRPACREGQGSGRRCSCP